MTPKILNTDACGGVLVNARGEVLLQTPPDFFGEYAWSITKGKAGSGERLDQAALRKVLGETGYHARIIAPIPVIFDATASTIAFYLMEPIGRQGKSEKGTATTRWVTFEGALDLISQTKINANRSGDLAVLRAAKEVFKKLPYADRPPTRQEDWQTQPMPWRRTKIVLDIPYDDGAMTLIRKGHLPTDMEEKWFAWFDQPVLHLHRSWTGFCIYQVSFVSDGGGWRASSALVNRNSKQYSCTNDDEDRKIISQLIDGLFVQRSD
jgi:ADP-ribose pyrophosphatase YjhB (NUDIX family)